MPLRLAIRLLWLAVPIWLAVIGAVAWASWAGFQAEIDAVRAAGVAACQAYGDPARIGRCADLHNLVHIQDSNRLIAAYLAAGLLPAAGAAIGAVALGRRRRPSAPIVRRPARTR
ncbi:MAG TPA: hypothetical protein VEH84_01745 [Alphaproteobacteria bacterium]|nr:hypothetical protein [Alphaproteobacteria bacterium]